MYTGLYIDNVWANGSWCEEIRVGIWISLIHLGRTRRKRFIYAVLER